MNDGATRRVVVGASREDSLGSGVDGVSNDNSASNAGAAYLFSGSNVQLAPEHYFKASNTDENDQFGFSVADGALIVVGALETVEQPVSAAIRMTTAQMRPVLPTFWVCQIGCSMTDSGIDRSETTSRDSCGVLDLLPDGGAVQANGIPARAVCGDRKIT